MNTYLSGFHFLNWQKYYLINADKNRYERLDSYSEKSYQTFPLQIDGAWFYQFNLAERLGNLCLKPMKWVAQGLHSSSTALKVVAFLVDVIALPLLFPLLGIGLALKNGGEYLNKHKADLQQIRNKYISIQDGIDRLQYLENAARKNQEQYKRQFWQPILKKMDEKQMDPTETDALKNSILDLIKNIGRLDIDSSFSIEEVNQAEKKREISDRAQELSQLLQRKLQINMGSDKILAVVKNLNQTCGLRIVMCNPNEDSINEGIVSYNELIHS